MHYTAKIEAKNKTYFLGVATSDNPSGDRKVCIGEVLFREENDILFQDIV